MLSSKVSSLLSRADRLFAGRGGAGGMDALESRQMMAADLSVTLNAATTAFDWLVPGDKVVFEVTVSNVGDEDAVGEVDLKGGARLLESDAGAMPELLFGSRRLFVDMAPGASKVYKISGKVPSAFTPGEYVLGAGLDVPDVDDSLYGSLNPVNDANLENNLAMRESATGMYYRFGNWSGDSARTTRTGLKLMVYVNEDGSALPATGSDDQLGGWEEPAYTFPPSTVLANITLAGGGYGELLPSEDGSTLALYETTTSSAFGIAVKGGSKRMTFVGDVIVNGSLKSFKAAGVSFEDTWLTATGSLDDFGVAALTRSALDVAGSNVAMKFAATTLTDFSINTAAAIASLRVSSWGAGDSGTTGSSGDANVLVSPWVGQFTSLGDAEFDMYLSGTGARNGVALSKLSVKGSASGDWSVRGAAGVLALGSTDENFFATFQGGLSSLVVAGDLSGVLTAYSMTKVAVGGDLVDAMLISGMFIGDDLDLGGDGQDEDTMILGGVSGSIASLAVKGGLIGSSIYCGATPTEGGESSWILGQTSALRKLAIGTEMSESVIYAQTIPAALKISGVRVLTADFPESFVTT